MDRDRIRLQALEDDGVLSSAEVTHALELQRRTGEPVDRVLTQLGLVSESDLAQRFAGDGGHDLLTPAALRAACAFDAYDDRINPEFAWRERVIPVADSEEGLWAACVDPAREAGLEGIGFAAARPVRALVATASQFEQIYKARFESGGVDDPGTAEPDVSADSDRLRDMASSAPVIRLVNRLITQAVEARASDVHIEQGSRDAEVRYRVDGVLRPVDRLPTAQAVALVSRVKVLADLDIAERRRPQDGRITVPVAGRAIDLRVSVVPAQHGESLVIRLLDPDASLRDIDDLGFSDQVRHVAETAIARPHGLVLVTGPTGSGKTTSLYAFLRKLADGERKILTIEDPIEYRLPGIAQSQTNSLIGVTFASALRSFLRHDPDIVMVGEIRDAETARTAVQAAMTGHLVLSTLHTNDAPSAVVRLIDMGVEDYLLASTLTAVLGQRLVRRVCSECAGAGCEVCQGTGYRGRVALAEGFAVDDRIRDVITQDLSGRALREAAAAAGYVPMSDLGRRLVESGLIRDADLQRAVGGP